MRILALAGLVAASLALGQEQARLQPGEELLKFTLEETRGEVAAKLGVPAHTGAFGPGYFSWFYKIGMADEHDFSHTILFRESDGKVVSITRAFDPEVTVDHLFPVEGTEMRYWPERKNPQFKARVRRMGGGLVLVAMGSESGKPCGQLVLIRESAAKIFFPWLD